MPALLSAAMPSVDLADAVDAGHSQREALDLQTAVELDVGAARGHELLEVGRNGSDFVEVETDSAARPRASAADWD